VPSNVDVVDDPEGVAAVRRRVAPDGQAVIASFSAFSELIGPVTSAALVRLLLDRPDRVGLLIGMKGEALADDLAAEHPGLRGRLAATGVLAPDDLSRHLQASDLVVQPYPDGVTSRRTTAMAALAHGVPVVTNAGHLCEPLWAESGAVALAPAFRGDDLAAAAERLLAGRAERDRIAAAGRALYQDRFAIGRLVDDLIAAPAGGPS